MKSPFDRFDRIVMIHCAKARDRLVGIDAELRRIGMLPDDSGLQFTYQVGSLGEHERRLYSAMRDQRFRIPKTDEQMDCAMNHLRAIRTAFDGGAQSMMVMEDDIRFMKDADRALSTIAKWDRNAYPICLFDKFVWDDALLGRSGEFIPFTKAVLGASCYGMTRIGMEAMLTAADNLLRNRKTVVVADELFEYVSVPRCFANKNICVQRDFAGSMNSTIFKCFVADVYRRMRIDSDLYAER